MHILLAEDEPSIAITLTDDLEAAGCAVAHFADGGDAIAGLRQSAFDCIISDLRLPGADGLRVLSAARAAHPQALAILISAYATPEHIADCARLGAQFVRKPFLNDELLRLIADHPH